MSSPSGALCNALIDSLEKAESQGVPKGMFTSLTLRLLQRYDKLNILYCKVLDHGNSLKIFVDQCGNLIREFFEILRT